MADGEKAWEGEMFRLLVENVKDYAIFVVDPDRHVRKDGTRFWASRVVTPLRDEGGTLRGFAKIMRDRTDLKRAEERLREVEARRTARLAVTQILADAASLEEACPLV